MPRRRAAVRRRRRGAGGPGARARANDPSALFYVPDGIAPWPSQTVRWALDFALGFFGGRAELRDEVVRRLDLEPLLDSAIGTLSKGQKKRALLAIGLLAPQPLLLADEPFDGLDLRQTREVAATLRAYAAGRAHAVSLDPSDQRRGAHLRSLRAAERRSRVRRRHASTSCRRSRRRAARRRAPAISKRSFLRSRRSAFVLAAPQGVRASWSRRAPGGSCSWRWDRSSACRSSAPCGRTPKRAA